MKLVIDQDGTATALYRDELLALGDVVAISRASHVEWEPGGWYVQLSDDHRNGEHAGQRIGEGFTTRAEALMFEVAWLEKEKLK